MATLTEVRQAILHQEPMLGRTFPIASAAVQTLTVTALATGTTTARLYSEKWLLRPDAALSVGVAVDRIRISSDYASATGVITQAGAAYSDTTATDENVEIHEFDPYKLETAIQEALGSTTRVDESILQARSDGIYDFSLLTWLKQPSDIALCGVRGAPIITGNRKFGSWGIVSSAGALQPDRWTLAGSGATFARSTTSRNGPYSLKITRSGTDVTVGQTAQVITSNTDDTSLRGTTVTGVLVGMTAVASNLFVRVTSEDVSGTVLKTTNSSYHTGSGAWEEVSVEHAVDEAADIIRVQAISDEDGDSYLDDLYLTTTTLGDGQRLDRYNTEWWRGYKDFTQNPMLLWAPDGGRRMDAQLVVRSLRKYPTFDAARVLAGLADDDETDCPLELLKYRALARFFRSIARDTEGNANLVAKANEYEQMADSIAQGHIADLTTIQPGAQMMSGAQYGTAMPRGR
jgi:hypothetical protein